MAHPQPVANPPEHTLWREQDHHDDGHAEDDALDTREPCAELRVQDLADRDEEGSADDRPPHGADAAEHRDGQRLCRHEHAEYGSRRDDEQDDGVKRAGGTGHGAAQRDGAQLPAQRVDAGGLGGGLVLFDSDQSHAEAGALNPAGEQGHDEEHHKRDHHIGAVIVELHVGPGVLALERKRDLLVTEPFEHVEHRKGIGEHRQGEVVPAQAEGREPDDEPGSRADERRQRQREPGGHVKLVGEKYRRVGAETEEGSMAERNEPGHAAEHVPGQAEAGPDQHKREHQLVIGVLHQQRDAEIE